MSEDPIHFPATPPYSKWPAVNDVFDCIRNGNWDVAKAVFAAHRQDITDAIGNINEARAAFNGGVPVRYKGRLSSSPYDFVYAPGEALAFDADTIGHASASVNEGGTGLYGAVFDSLPTTVNKSQWQTWGKVAIFNLAIKPGQYFVAFSEAAIELAGRADVR